MTFRTFVSSRYQVTIALMLGTCLTMSSRSHFNQMLVDATSGHSMYSAMNIVFQVMYAVVQVPAALYVDRINPAPALAAVLLGLAATSVVAPFTLPGLSSSIATAVMTVTPYPQQPQPYNFSSSADMTTTTTVFVTGVLFAVNGAMIGAWWPLTNAMLSAWAPFDELAYMYATINTGVPGGIVLGNAFTGLFYGVHGSGFRYSFFVIAFVCTLWSVTWLYAFYRRPSDDPGVRPAELEYLTANIRPKTTTTLAVPWRAMAVSGPAWSVMVANYGSTVFYTVLVMYMPVYLRNAVHVEIAQNGLMSAAPSLGQMLVMYAAGCVAWYVHANRLLSVTNVRKVFTFIGMILPAGIISIASVCSDKYIFYGLLVVAYAISGSVFSGFRVSQMELAPNFVGAITAICDLVGSLAMNSTHIAFIIGFGQTAEQITWNIICWILTIVLVICASLFLIFGSSEIQPWNSI